MNGILFLALLSFGFGLFTLYSRMLISWCEYKMDLAKKEKS